MENEDLAENPHRWCRLAHRTRLYVSVSFLLLAVVSAVAAGEVLVLAYLAVSFAACGGYVWWAWVSVKRDGVPESTPEESGERDFHVALYAKKGWARLAVATDLLVTAFYSVAGVLVSAPLRAGSGGSLSVVVTAGLLLLGAAVGLALIRWDAWVHDQAVGFHVVDSDGTVLSTS